jgi:hypothetical protein
MPGYGYSIALTLKPSFLPAWNKMATEMSDSLPEEVEPVLHPHLTLVARLDKAMIGGIKGEEDAAVEARFMAAAAAFANSNSAFVINPDETVIHSPVKYCKEDTATTGLQALVLMFTEAKNPALFDLRKSVGAVVDISKSEEPTHTKAYEPHLSLVYWSGAENAQYEGPGCTHYENHKQNLGELIVTGVQVRDTRSADKTEWKFLGDFPLRSMPAVVAATA